MAADVPLIPGQYVPIHVNDIDPALWPIFHFEPHEVMCPCCGMVKAVPDALYGLDRLRSRIGKPLVINSGYRCPLHNEKVGGAKNSKHMYGTAFDVSSKGHTLYELFRGAEYVGFKAFGFYPGFIHIDLGPARMWVG